MPGRRANRTVRCDALNAQDLAHVKRSVVRIKDTDEGVCGFQAVVVGQWLAQGQSRKLLSHQHELVLARQLCDRAGLIWGGACGPLELDRLQTVLKLDGMRLHVFYHHLRYVGWACNWVDFEPDWPRWDVVLYHHDDHYDVITSMTGFLAKSYYCMRCDVGYQTKSRHQCTTPCACCYQDQCSAREGTWMACPVCRRTFKSDACYGNHGRVQAHRVQGRVEHWSVCQRYQRCPDCQKVVDLRQKQTGTLQTLLQHRCGEFKCVHCQERVVDPHWCYVQPVVDPDDDDDATFRYLFFDFEAMPLQATHEVNLVVVLQVCDQCCDSVHHDGQCPQCQDRRKVFRTVHDFCHWLFRPEHRNTVAMAHNFMGYDSYPILEWLCQQGVRPDVVFRGAHLLYLRLPQLNIVFKDSLCFLPMALRKFSKTFDLPEEKGYFPHFFNTPEHQTYVGPYPDLASYGVDTLPQDAAEQLRQWHAEQWGKTFDFQKELLHYCEQDVILLKRGVMTARRIFQDVTGFDPFQKCITLAATCMRSFRRNFMPPQSIGLVPPGGYTPRDVQSWKAKQWLWWLQHQPPHRVLQTCASPQGEARVLGAKVDGYDPTTKTVYQFHGCFWHACAVCFPNGDVYHPQLRQKMKDIRAATEERTRRLQQQGYGVVVEWEHDWDARLDLDIPRGLLHQEPLNPRDGLYGGRTNALRLYYACQPDEQIDYVDFTSLYPSVMLDGGAYPVGHPTLIREQFQFPLTEHYYGMNKVKVLPPRTLYLPVLPLHVQGKLMFPLCRTCAETLNQTTRCRHNLEERALVGVWATPELQKAVALGYRVLDVYEVWHYPPTSTQLFGDYVRTYLKVKQEASGWPQWCQTDAQRTQYVAQYEKHQGIRLRPDHVAHNPGLRAVAKTILNSLWGKLGQNPDRTFTEYVDSPVRFAELMFGVKTDVKHLLMVHDDMVQVQYDKVGDFRRESDFASVVHAAFVTSFARLKLYRCLETLQERVLYFDTDSVIYVTRTEDTALPLGDYLGELRSELAPNDTIDEPVSTGRKVTRTRGSKANRS